MEVINLFPTQIYKDFVNDNMRNDLLELCNHYTSVSNTNLLHIENFPSTLANDDLSYPINTSPVVKMVFNYLYEVANQFTQQRNQKLRNDSLQPYGFFSDMKKGAYLRKHTHKDCRFSGIIYLEVGDNVPPLVFHDPRPYTKFESSKYCTNPVITIPPQQGMMLIWDHWLEHEVYTKTNDNPRKSFTFNI